MWYFQDLEYQHSQQLLSSCYSRAQFLDLLSDETSFPTSTPSHTHGITGFRSGNKEHGQKLIRAITSAGISPTKPANLGRLAANGDFGEPAEKFHWSSGTWRAGQAQWWSNQKQSTVLPRTLHVTAWQRRMLITPQHPKSPLQKAFCKMVLP